MQLRRETIVNASADSVWKVLGNQFNDVYLWASSVHHSKNHGDRGRICETELGPFKETLEHFDDHSKKIAYSAEGEKMPFFVKKMLNTWQVHAISATQSKVTMVLNVRISFPFNVLMALPMRMQLSGVLKKAHQELKYFVEHGGKAHPRKRASASKYTSKKMAVAK